jgi:acyl carrier protein
MNEKIIKIVSSNIGVPVDQESKMEDYIEWDSLNHVKIISSLQNELKIKIPPEDIDKLTSVKKIIDYITSK